jgi:alpha-galactosidase
MAKIAVIGAGSASFGENRLAALMRSKKLRGSHLALADRNTQSLDIVHRLATRLNKEWDSNITISANTNHKDALDSADFVILAIEVGPREELWKSDYDITLKYGIHQPYAENGGSSGFIHAARNITPLMEILRDME